MITRVIPRDRLGEKTGEILRSPYPSHLQLVHLVMSPHPITRDLCPQIRFAIRAIACDMCRSLTQYCKLYNEDCNKRVCFLRHKKDMNTFTNATQAVSTEREQTNDDEALSDSKNQTYACNVPLRDVFMRQIC